MVIRSNLPGKLLTFKPDLYRLNGTTSSSVRVMGHFLYPIIPSQSQFLGSTPYLPTHYGVGGIAVAVGGMAVADGGRGVAVGGKAVALGGMAVAAGP